MKTTIALSALALTLSSFTTTSNEAIVRSTEYTARLALDALKHASIREYESLYPTLSDFKSLMDAHAGFYGTNLDEAKKEFGRTYKKNVLPELNDSFNQLLKEGKEKGIDWSKVSFARVEGGKSVASTLVHTNLTIVFTHEENEYSILVKDALFINGKWRVSQFTKLESL